MYQKELKLLGYTEKWLQSGILSPERLLSEVKKFQSPDGDPYIEHYRAMTLSDFLRQRDSLTDDGINDYLQIAYEDEDIDLLTSIFALMECRALTDEQFASLQLHPAIKQFETSRTYSRQKLLRAIDNQGLTLSVIDECVAIGDSKVQRRLLEFELDKETLETLVVKGVNKTIRNSAKTRLKQHKYKDNDGSIV